MTWPFRWIVPAAIAGVGPSVAAFAAGEHSQMGVPEHPDGGVMQHHRQMMREGGIGAEGRPMQYGQHPAMTQHHQLMMGMQCGMSAQAPGQPGHAACGTVQEIVGLLEADPNTDWSRVNLAALREHLIDMDEVTLRATAKEEPIDGGLKVEVSGSG